MHAYTADNQSPQWRRAIERVKAELPETMPLLIGHGEPVTTGFLSWQRAYLDRFEELIRQADWSDQVRAVQEVMAGIKGYLPSENLAFLAELSVPPTAKRLGLL
jgi:hypothetical protein